MALKGESAACSGGSDGDGAARTQGSAPPAHANDNLTTIKVLSNRADLISGGDALVEFVLPAKGQSSAFSVDVAGQLEGYLTPADTSHGRGAPLSIPDAGAGSSTVTFSVSITTTGSS